MKRNFYAAALGLLTLGTTLTTQAQDFRQSAGNPSSSRGRGCVAMEVLAEQLAADPTMAQRMSAIENQTARYQSLLPSQRSTAVTVTIPVVVHVVYNTSTQNVPLSQITAQMDVLNQDFAKTNPDASLIPAAFAGSAASTNVRFVLAQRDPNGLATTGIIRKQTKVTSWSSNDAVKNSKRGGSDAWPRDKYLNIWVCNLGGGLLGYAQFPGGQASTDGVVVLYSSLPGGTAAPYNKGRTATHEVGHWLNLRHIWGDASCGNDYVSDTPTQQTSNYGCPSFPKVTCSNGPNGDMFMNYMDYTDDACMYMFSNGQSTRMDALFATGGARVGLVTSLGGTAPRATAPLLATTAASLYPNPASDVLNINVGDAKRTADAAYSVKVYDLRGFEMKQAQYNGNGQVRVDMLPKGLYYVTITDGVNTQHQRFQKD
ncbi:T9SS type A sorting domain-containing protein [Hymenobacter sp. BT175]|uniref:M43 family zinc metalloprotease n=1 Tax=Hymenobacter translucens TaxID=2886507 RepID=UPI001D0E8C3F|nr:M43 family zinc metalloprotease [Hymenobacter translucens]MCC2547292.1 T9SS type A sorting domain-containing protein [Hymenobacter translucens]